MFKKKLKIIDIFNASQENLPDHIIFPKELNLFLRNRIQVIRINVVYRICHFCRMY